MSAVEAEVITAPAAVGILFNLPDEMQTTVVLRALVCAELAGYERHSREPAAAALSRVRLSSNNQEPLRAVVDELVDVFRDIVLGADMMLQPGVASGAFASYAREVRRVAKTAIAQASRS